MAKLLGEELYKIKKVCDLAVVTDLGITFTAEEAYIIGKSIETLLLAFKFSLDLDEIWKEFSTNKEEENAEEKEE